MEALTQQRTYRLYNTWGATESKPYAKTYVRRCNWWHFYEGDSLVQVNFDAEECHCGCATVPNLLLIDGRWKVGYDCHVASIEDHFADERTAARYGAW